MAWRRLVLSMSALALWVVPSAVALETEAFQGLEAEVRSREAAIPADASHEQLALKKLYQKVLRSFDAASGSWKSDGRLAGKIVKALDRALPSDTAMQGLLLGGLGAFVEDMEDALAWVVRGLALAQAGNPYLARAQAALAKADESVRAAAAKGAATDQARLAAEAAGAVDTAVRYAQMAFDADRIVVPPAPFSHREHFEANQYVGAASCLGCHADVGADILTTGHWNWEGVTANVAGHETESHGKQDFINNFCIAVASNEGRCTQCHIGIGWADRTFDLNNPKAIDCLVCHDQTDTYGKDPRLAGAPLATVNLQAVARSVGDNHGVPTRRGCGMCHFNAGGADNVKHGDLSTDMLATTREYDVHMGTDGGNFVCVECHQVKRDEHGKALSHGIGGMPFHSVDEGNMQDCVSCHTADPHPASYPVRAIVMSHPRLSCQACHIPAIARKLATKMEWYWETAGDSARVPVIDPVTGRPDYDKMKGDFVWAKNVRPTLRWFNGKWDRVMVNVNDTYVTTPVVLAQPLGTAADPQAKIYPFKKMIGTQVADAVNNRIMVPHLFGTKTGANPYWTFYNWDLAVQDGADYSGQPYSGSHTFVDTVMYLTVNHEVAPKTLALGAGGNCDDCHLPGAIDWAELGRPANPYPVDYR